MFNKNRGQSVKTANSQGEGQSEIENIDEKEGEIIIYHNSGKYDPEEEGDI